MAQNAAQMENDLDYVLAQLQLRKGIWPQIERDTGLDYSWLSKLSRGLIEDPGYLKVRKLAGYFRLLEKQEAERSAAAGSMVVNG